MGNIIASDHLVSIVYVSSGLREYTDAEFAGILTQSRRNNERDGLTGMLLYSNGNFLQVIEGPNEAVRTTLERIKADPRHRGIIVLKKTSIQSRVFSEWTMAFRKLESDELGTMGGYSPFMEISFDSHAFQVQPGFQLSHVAAVQKQDALIFGA